MGIAPASGSRKIFATDETLQNPKSDRGLLADKWLATSRGRWVRAGRGCGLQ